MMLHFVMFVTILICGEIFPQTSAADLEHFAIDKGHKNNGDWNKDVKEIREAGKKDVIIFFRFATITGS